MRLYTFEINGQRHIGAEWGGQIFDLKAAHSAMVGVRRLRPGAKAAMPTDMLAFVRAGEPALRAAREALEFMGKRPALPIDLQVAYPLEGVRTLAPLGRPGKILCSGINFRSHQEENPNATLPDEPFFFSKLPSTVIGQGDSIVLPGEARQVDYEVELAVVIGQRMKDTPESDVLTNVFGYTILHDVSARDVQFKDNQITVGKNFDTFSPTGPCIVTTDEIRDPGRLALRTFINGKLLQDGHTRDWLFPLPTLLSWLSHRITLDPGDVVSTGTPAGCGFFRQPQLFLQAGDTVRLEIEGIGALENPVVGSD